MNRSESDITVDLLRDAQAGDEEALDRLFARYLPIVVRIVEIRAGRAIRGNVELEDLVQESLLDAFRGLGRFEHRGEGSFRHWLAGIVENNLRDANRHRTRKKRGGGRERRFADVSASLHPGSVLGDEPTPSAIVRGQELEDRIHEILTHGLDGRYRDVIVFRKLCQMEFDEIAEVMGYQDARSVRALFSRAMKALREAL